MLADVGMLKMYSKSAHVNDLGFAWTGPPPLLHVPAILFVPTAFLLGGFAMPCRYTLHHPYICPCFWRKHFCTPLFLYFLMEFECELLMGQSTFMTSKQQWKHILNCGRVCSTMDTLVIEPFLGTTANFGHLEE